MGANIAPEWRKFSVCLTAPNPVGIVFRGGTGSSGTGAERTVSRVELVTALQRALHEGRLRIAKGLPEAAALVREFADFQLTFSPSGTVQWGAASGRHDDRIVAICCALWGAIDGSRADGWLEHFGRLAREAKGEILPRAKVPPPLFAIPATKPAATSTLRTPRPHMNFYVRSRRRYVSGPDCLIADVQSGDDVDDLKASGCVVVEESTPLSAASMKSD